MPGLVPGIHDFLL